MTEQEYIDNVRARFGTADPAKLAILENARMRLRMGLSCSYFAVGSWRASDAARERLSKIALEKGRQRMEAAMAALTEPMTTEQMATVTGWPVMTVRRALNRATAEGRAILVRRKAPQIWQRAQEAAE